MIISEILRLFFFAQHLYHRDKVFLTYCGGKIVSCAHLVISIEVLVASKHHAVEPSDTRWWRGTPDQLWNRSPA